MYKSVDGQSSSSNLAKQSIVYTKITGEMDASKAKFETALSREMARFDELTR